MMWRFIVDEGTAEHCMALDEALFNLRNEDKTKNILRLYVFKPSAITIGYFQKIYEVVDMEYAKAVGIPIVRRITGGGAVFHDQHGEITYSIISGLEDFPSDVQQSYEKICQGIIFALKKLGLEAAFTPVNDVVVGTKKISGSAQTRKNKALLQHGTLLYNTDVMQIGKLLKVPKEKLIAHDTESIYERVTTISRELGRTVTKGEVIEALTRGFQKALKVELRQDRPSENEIDLTKKLEKKCGSVEWNFRR